MSDTPGLLGPRGDEQAAPEGGPVEGIDPIAEMPRLDLPATARPIHPGLVMRLRGRTVRLAGLRRPPAGIWRVLAILGPGIIAGAVGNDAGSIATLAQAGARYGYDLLWLFIPLTISLALIQEMAARLGAATGRGLLELIRERFGIAWAVVAVLVVGLANFGLVISEFVGVGAAAELFGISKYIAVPLAALLVWYLVVAGSYPRVEKIFMVMAAGFLTYAVAAVLAHPHLGDLARGLVPTVHRDPAYIALLVGLIGATISPYQQVFQQSAVVERGAARRHYGPERWDTYAGMVFSDLVSVFIIVATAATLHAAGHTNINTAADAARALAPAAGTAAEALFGIGLLGAAVMAAAILPIATAFSVAEAFGLPKGVGLTFRVAPGFFGLFSALTLVGAGLALIPGLPVISFLVLVQVLNGVLLPVTLVFVMLLINDARLMGDLKNARLANVLGWGTTGLITAAVLFLLVQQGLGLLGIGS